MPELHKLTPPLGVLQDRGHRVALVTDGRMSGASGKVPAAIHLTPEAAVGGPAGAGARRRPGHASTPTPGTLELHVDAARVRRAARRPRPPDRAFVGTGRELFAAFRAAVGPADEGASIFRDAAADGDAR